jgi:hypothetical protein
MTAKQKGRMTATRNKEQGTRNKEQARDWGAVDGPGAGWFAWRNLPAGLGGLLLVLDPAGGYIADGFKARNQNRSHLLPPTSGERPSAC